MKLRHFGAKKYHEQKFRVHVNFAGRNSAHKTKEPETIQVITKDLIRRLRLVLQSIFHYHLFK